MQHCSVASVRPPQMAWLSWHGLLTRSELEPIQSSFCPSDCQDVKVVLNVILQQEDLTSVLESLRNCGALRAIHG